MFESLVALNAERQIEVEEEGIEFPPLNIGIGINTGDCVVGNMIGTTLRLFGSRGCREPGGPPRRSIQKLWRRRGYWGSHL